MRRESAPPWPGGGLVRADRGWAIGRFALALFVFTTTVGTPASAQVNTKLVDFFAPGTQPDESKGVDFAPLLNSMECRICHESYELPDVPVYSRWTTSMMAQSARDPLFQACLTIANQDAAFAGDLCLRCHTPGGWLAGRSEPTDGSALIEDDLDGVTCTACHRMVDPDFKPGISPSSDEAILDALKLAGVWPAQPGNASFVIDPDYVRRGPFDDVPFNMHGKEVEIIYSPFHKTAELCATCHDVSNPAFSRQPDGTYALNDVGEEHPTLDKYDMFPLERTYSEWRNSAYANGGVDMQGVFGGNHPTGVMVTCQDCHMPSMETYACAIATEPFFVRPDVTAHDFVGGNTWMIDAVNDLYPFTVYPWYVGDMKDRARYMLQHAATLDVVQDGCDIRVRIYNQAGHKLPTGYPEGRRMWLNVQFHDAQLNVVAERGAYAELTADLTTADTKVYEVKQGLDAALADRTGLPVGPSFHFALNNKYYKDNRIPPRGFTNAAFEAVQAAPVGAVYKDGQHWDDTVYRVPPGARSATVTLYYQTVSKEYITFLRDENRTNNTGEVLFNQWQMWGMSSPELMKEVVISALSFGRVCDADCDGDVDLVDYRELPSCLTGPAQRLSLGCEAFDADFDGDVDASDVAHFQRAYLSTP